MGPGSRVSTRPTRSKGAAGAFHTPPRTPYMGPSSAPPPVSKALKPLQTFPTTAPPTRVGGTGLVYKNGVAPRAPTLGPEDPGKVQGADPHPQPLHPVLRRGGPGKRLHIALDVVRSRHAGRKGLDHEGPAGRGEETKGCARPWGLSQEPNPQSRQLTPLEPTPHLPGAGCRKRKDGV